MAAALGLSVGPRSRSPWNHERLGTSQPVVALHRLGGPPGRGRVLGRVSVGFASGGSRVPPLGIGWPIALFGPSHGASPWSQALVGRRHCAVHAHVAAHQTPRRRHPSTGLDGRPMGGGFPGWWMVRSAVWHGQMERRPRRSLPRPCGTALPHSIWGLPAQGVHPGVHRQRLGRGPIGLSNTAAPRAVVQRLRPAAVG